MEITGKIIAVLPKQGGTSKSGNAWEKQDYVLETFDQYPKKICFQIFGSDRIVQADIHPNDELIVNIEIESREYQGKWFTNINCRGVNHISTQQPAGGQKQQPYQKPQPTQSYGQQSFPSGDSDDNLPF